MGEAILELPTDAGAVAQQIPRAEQQVDEVETPGAFLQTLVVLDHAPELVAYERRQIGTRAVDELAQARAKAVAPLEQLAPVAGAKVAVGALPVPVISPPDGAQEARELALEAVVIAAAN